MFSPISSPRVLHDIVEEGIHFQFQFWILFFIFDFQFKNFVSIVNLNFLFKF